MSDRKPMTQQDEISLRLTLSTFQSCAGKKQCLSTTQQQYPSTVKHNLFHRAPMGLERCQIINSLPFLFKALLHGQEDLVFFTGRLNLRTTPEIGLPSRKKIIN
jgi:hypothetical protein